jgi:hypothetical protein
MRVESFKLALIPVWMTRAADHGEDDLLLINGQSGAIGGREQEKRGLWEWLADGGEG